MAKHQGGENTEFIKKKKPIKNVCISWQFWFFIWIIIVPKIDKYSDFPEEFSFCQGVKHHLDQNEAKNSPFSPRNNEIIFSN